jgi:hypothetical protein
LPDFVNVRNVLTNYAGVGTGSSGITAPLVSKGYFVAYDFINSGLTAPERTAILTRLGGSNVLGKFGTPSNNNNQTFINYGARGLYALLAGNTANLNSALNSLRSGYTNNTTDDGFMTDGDRYLNYTMGPMAPFLNAYRNGSGDATGTAQFVNVAEQHAQYALGIRMPNGLSPSFHNSDTVPIVIQELSRSISDSQLRAAVLWYAEELGAFSWSGWTNALNNQNGWTDLFWTVATDVAPAAPTWSPTYFSGGQAKISVFRNDWGTDSNYLAITAGIDNSSSFAQHDTGAITLVAEGTQVLVEPGYSRYNGFLGIGADSAMPNTPAGGSPNLVTSNAIEHNVLLARNTGSSSWGIGNGNAQAITTTNTTVTNRLDSMENGSFKGVADFSTLRTTYGGSGAGSSVQVRRSTAMINESSTDRGYFSMADSFRRTNSTNKDVALNLIGKSTAANTSIMANAVDYKKIRWTVDSYLGTYSATNNPGLPASLILGFPYNQTIDGQVIAHIVSSGSMNAVAQDTSWMIENWGVFIQTQRMRVSLTNIDRGAFLTLFETGAANASSRWTVTPLSGTDYAAARIVSLDGWTDWHLSQTSSTNVHATSVGASLSIDSGALVSNAQYAYLRKVSSTLDSAMVSRGTTLSSAGTLIFSANNPVTTSLLFSNLAGGEISGTISMDDYTNNTVLTFNLPAPITSVTYNGAPLATFTASTVTIPSAAGVESASFVINF